MEKGSLKEHLLLAASRIKRWFEFVNEIESIELARRTASHPQPMQLDAIQQAFRGTRNKCGRI
eukprot:10452367-Karenia_brevis.AAC.1